VRKERQKEMSLFFPLPYGGEDEGEGEKIQNHPSRIERDGGKSER